VLQIIYSLTAGDSLPPIIDNQIEQFVQKLKFQLEELLWLARLTGVDDIKAAYEAYEALDEREKLGFFLSPAVFSEISAQRSSGQPPNLRGLIELCVKESAFSASAAPSDKELWNPLFSKARNWKGSPEPLYVAPLLGNSIAIDVGSPFCRRSDLTSPVFYGELNPLTDEEKSLVVDKISKAFAEIEATAPIFARIIRNYTRLICVRKREGVLPASEQVSNEIGAIRLLNVNTALYTHEQLMDDLIHESVHNFLSTYEFLEHPFQIPGGRTDRDARPVSPWSMRPIRILPFLHAVFVYFAILHYSMKRMERTDLSAEQRQEAMYRRNRWASGFLMPGALSSYVKAFADVDPRVLHAMDQMQLMVRRKFSQGLEDPPKRAAAKPPSGLEATAP
jgi:hypothetical protein